MGKMKIQKGYKLRELAGQGVVVATGAKAREFNGMIRLNESGTLIWQMLEKGATREELVEKIVATYEVDKEAAGKDIDEILRQLLMEGILE